MQFDVVLRTFAEFFEREGIRYALAGGNALVAWGHQRITYDIDFAAEGTASERIIRHAESLGYETTFASQAFSNHHHPNPALGHMDFLYLYGQTADAVFAAAVRRDRAGVDIPVTQPEHLIAMKVQAMKNTPMRVLIDAPDIAFLLSLPNIDRDRVREYFVQHGLLKIYDELEKERAR